VIYVAIVLQWLHVIAGIGWFGSSIFILRVMMPAVRSMSEAAAGEYLRALEKPSTTFFAGIGGATVLLGILRGLVLGITPGSLYGVTYILAAILGIALLAYGGLVTSRNVKRMTAVAGTADFRAAADRTVRFGWLEMGGFLVLFTLMIAMRFGY
jgi:uncharacterized membrane protein